MARCACLAALFLALAPSAAASEPLADFSVRHVRLEVNRKGEALLTYHRAGGVRRVLVWGATNARVPNPAVRQVRFRYDYAGGWGRYRRLYWRTFTDACRPYTGPSLVALVVACTAPDGSWWAVQSWQRFLPHRGHPPWQAHQSAWELRVSHWTGPLARLEVYTDWAFSGEAHDLFGRLTYAGAPVHGFGTARDGNPTDRYGRGLYIDTLDSAYGRGWRRETSVVFRKPTGGFCYSFWPTRDVTLPGYPDDLRPAGKGKRYRIRAAGPGVTPDVQVEVPGLHDFNPRNPKDVAYERSRNALFDRILQGDRFCATQH